MLFQTNLYHLEIHLSCAKGQAVPAEFILLETHKVQREMQHRATIFWQKKNKASHSKNETAARGSHPPKKVVQ